MKIGFLCAKGLETFVQPIADYFEKKSGYTVEKHWLSDFNNIVQKIENQDIVWIEWADAVAINLTMQCVGLLKDKKVIVRLHSYEALAQFHQQINWTAVDTVVFVSNHIQKYCALDHSHQIIIENGIDLKRFEFTEAKKHGENVATVGLFSSKKGTMLLAHAFNSLPKNFKLHIAGEWQDERERIYFAHMLDAMQLRERVCFYGRIENNAMQEWLSDKNYIICTSPWESQNLSICEAMAIGIKPLIHNFWGSNCVYPPELIWTNFDQLNAMVDPASKYDSHFYHQYIEKKFNQKDKLEKIDTLFKYLKAS